MDVEEFRKRGHETVEKICRYYKEIDNYKVLSGVEPGYLKELIPDSAPEEPEPWEAIQTDFDTKIMPGVTHWQSPNFFAFYPANSSFPGILGDMYSDMVNSIGFNWICSPAYTELETIVLDWVGKMIGLDEKFLSDGPGGGVIQTSISDGLLMSMVAARHRVLRFYRTGGVDVEWEGINDRLVAYCSDQTHSSMKKVCTVLGIRCQQLASDENQSLRGDVVNQAIENDISEGLVPFFVTGTIGTTTSAAVDNIDEIGRVIEKFEHATRIWFHIDAAYAGAALVCPEYRHYLKGIGRVHSFAFNMHKWLLTNFDCSCYWVHDRTELVEPVSLTPEFLRNEVSDEQLAIDYRDWQLPLGRRFRALKIWFVLRTYGASGLRQHIRKCVDLVHVFFQGLRRHRDIFVVPVDPAFSLVYFYVKQPKRCARTSNELTELVYKRANDSRIVFLTHSRIGEQFIIRFVVGSPWTEKRHVDQALELLVNITKQVLKENTM